MFPFLTGHVNVTHPVQRLSGRWKLLVCEDTQSGLGEISATEGRNDSPYLNNLHVIKCLILLVKWKTGMTDSSRKNTHIAVY
jgi:hypothetical protein